MEDINDENWCCVVVMLVENDVNHTVWINEFEEAATSIAHPSIVNVRRKDLLNVSSPRGKSISKKSYEDSLALKLKRFILARKTNDLKRKREEIVHEFFDKAVEDKHKFSMRFKSEYVSKKLKNFDMPRSGPNCYFVLTKFYDPSFPKEVLEERIPLIAIFEVSEIKFEQSAKVINRSVGFELKDECKSPDPVSHFWTNFSKVYLRPSNNEIFYNTIIFPINIYEIPYLKSSEEKEKKNVLFDFIKANLISLGKHMRIYYHFVGNVRQIETPILKSSDNALQEYNAILDSIPIELCDVEVIFHCLLEQVVANINKKKEESPKSSFNSGFLNMDKCSPYQIPDRKKGERKSESLDNEKSKTILINHRNRIIKKICNTKNDNIDILKVHLDLYMTMPYLKVMTDLEKRNPGVEVSINNQLLKIYKNLDADIDKETFIECLHLMHFCSLLNKPLPSEVDISLPTLLDPLSLFDAAKSTETTTEISQSTKKSVREIQLEILEKFIKSNEQLESLLSSNNDDLFAYSYCEDLPLPVFLQVLNKAYFSFTNFDYSYCHLTDSILLRFHNPMDSTGSFRDYKEGDLHTKMGFKDFFYSKILIAKMSSQSVQTDIKNIDEERKATWLKQNVPEMSDQEFPMDELDIHTPFPVESYSSKSNERKLKHYVYGSLGRSAIKVSEVVKKMYLCDGPVLTVKKTKWLPFGSTCTTQLDSHGHVITFHRTLKPMPRFSEAEVTPSECTSNQCDNNSSNNFLITSKEGIIFNVSYEEKEIPYSSFLKNECSGVPHNVFDFVISLPNGLKIELCRGEIPLLKQTYLVPFEKLGVQIEEECRVFLKDGTILIFLKNGSVLILYPNSTITRIKVIRKIRPYVGEDEANSKTNVTGITDTIKRIIFDIYKHEVIYPNGEFIRFCENKIELRETSYNVRAAVKNTIGLYAERTDGTKSYIDVEGMAVTVFPDETAITSCPLELGPEMSEESFTTERVRTTIAEEDGEEEETFEMFGVLFKYEHPNYMPVECSGTCWSVQLPFDVKFKTESEESFEIFFGDETRVSCNGQIMSVYSANGKKMTTTNFFFDSSYAFDNITCSTVDSSGTAYYVTKKGFTGVYNSENSYQFLENQEQHSLQDDACSEDLDIRSPTSNFYFDLCYMNRDLKWDYTTVHNDAKRTPPSFAPKKMNRYLIINRELSGYEFIHKEDNINTLNKFIKESEDIEKFPGFNIRKSGGFISSQRQLEKTWSDSMKVQRIQNPLGNIKLKRCELSSYIPREKKWLMDILPKVRYEEKPLGKPQMPDEVVWQLQKPVAILVRRVKNILFTFESNSAPELFRQALSKYEEVKDTLIHKYRNFSIPDTRSKSDITEAQEVFLRSQMSNNKNPSNLESILNKNKFQPESADVSSD